MTSVYDIGNALAALDYTTLEHLFDVSNVAEARGIGLGIQMNSPEDFVRLTKPFMREQEAKLERQRAFYNAISDELIKHRNDVGSQRDILDGINAGVMRARNSDVGEIERLRRTLEATLSRELPVEVDIVDVVTVDKSIATASDNSAKRIDRMMGEVTRGVDLIIRSLQPSSDDGDSSEAVIDVFEAPVLVVGTSTGDESVGSYLNEFGIGDEVTFDAATTVDIARVTGAGTVVNSVTPVVVEDGITVMTDSSNGTNYLDGFISTDASHVTDIGTETISEDDDNNAKGYLAGFM